MTSTEFSKISISGGKKHMQAFIQRTVTLKNITVTLKDFAVYEQRFQPLHKKLSNKMQVLSPYCRGDAC